MPKHSDLILRPNEKTRRWLDIALPVMAAVLEIRHQAFNPQARNSRVLAGELPLPALDDARFTVSHDMALRVIKTMGVDARKGEACWVPSPPSLPPLVAYPGEMSRKVRQVQMATLHGITALIASTMLPWDEKQMGWYVHELVAETGIGLGVTAAPAVVIQDFEKERCYFYGFMGYEMLLELQEWHHNCPVRFNYGFNMTFKTLDSYREKGKVHRDFTQPLFTETWSGTQYLNQGADWELLPEIIDEIIAEGKRENA